LGWGWAGHGAIKIGGYVEAYGGVGFKKTKFDGSKRTLYGQSTYKQLLPLDLGQHR